MSKQTTIAARHRSALGALLLMAAGAPAATPAQGVTYYVAAAGSDRSDGRSPRRPWRSLDRVNSADLMPGDAVLFRRGDTWRGSLTPRSGKEGAPIRYAAYGSGAKPCLMGSVARSSPADWRGEGDGLWSTGGHGPEQTVPMPPSPSPFSVDVGNLIFGDEVACGVKRWTRADLKAQGDFWYDPDRRMLWLKCDINPVRRYGRIECAMYRHIINQSERSYVTYEEFALKYGGAHGIGGAATHHITVRGCDISYIGGADQMGGDKRVRFGNGIEFWAGAHDNLVERCRLWEIYDAALTNQSMGDPVTEADITYRDNVIWNCEYSFEYWNRPETSTTRNIRFINNTCVDAGHGWGHAQRPDPSGCHLRFYESPARAQGIEISGNLFIEATGPAFYAPAWPADDVRALRMERNVWVQRRGTMISVAGRDYAMEGFAKYQGDLGLDRGSLTIDPRFVSPARRDYRLRPDSPCPGLGARTTGGK